MVTNYFILVLFNKYFKRQLQYFSIFKVTLLNDFIYIYKRLEIHFTLCQSGESPRSSSNIVHADKSHIHTSGARKVHYAEELCGRSDLENDFMDFE